MMTTMPWITWKGAFFVLIVSVIFLAVARFRLTWGLGTVGFKLGSWWYCDLFLSPYFGAYWNRKHPDGLIVSTWFRIWPRPWGVRKVSKLHPSGKATYFRPGTPNPNHMARWK